MNKYNATKIVIDDMIFDSLFEGEIYRTLKKLTTYRDNGITLSVKPGVMIKPKCEVFPALNWKCDFRLDHETLGAMNIEAKGFHTREFMLQMQMLEACNPSEFQRTIVIPLDDDVWKLYKRMKNHLWTISQMKERILDPRYWRMLNGS
jgi:Protein of unknown function (DUF1064)